MSVKITDEMVDAYKAAYSKHMTDSIYGFIPAEKPEISKEATRRGLEAALAHTAEKGEAEPVCWVDPAYMQWLPKRNIMTMDVARDPKHGYVPLYAHPPAPRDDLVAEVEEWRAARKATTEVGVRHPEYMARLNRLSEAEDALAREGK